MGSTNSPRFIFSMLRKDLLGNEMTVCPTMLKYSVHAKSNSIFNTPPVWSIYMMMLNLRYLKKIGGVPAIEKINRKKAQMLYDYIDSTPFYQNNVERSCRSIMNVPFVTGSKELDDKFVNKATEAGLVNIKGHKVVGGMRASIYNAMPIEGIEALIEFMKKFEEENK